MAPSPCAFTQSCSIYPILPLKFRKITPSSWSECLVGLSSPRSLSVNLIRPNYVVLTQYRRATSVTCTHTNTLGWPTPRSISSVFLVLVQDLNMFDQVIDISDSASGVKILTRKTKSSPHAVASATATSTIRPRSGSRRALGIASATAKRGYRPDLRTVSLCSHIPFVLSLFFFSERTLVRTHWNYWKVIEGWAWTCLQYQFVSSESIKTPMDIAPCRYRTPFVAHRGGSDSLALTLSSHSISRF